MPDGKEEGKGGGDTTTIVDDDSWLNVASGDISDYDYSKADDISDVIYSGHVTDADDTTYTGNEDYSSYGDFSGQTPLPDGKEENPYIPPVPYKPPVELPTDAPPPPPPRPRVVPPRHENPVLNTQPVLNRTRVLDNSRVTKNLFKQPKQEESRHGLNIPFEKRKYRYLVQPDQDFEFYVPPDPPDDSKLYTDINKLFEYFQKEHKSFISDLDLLRNLLLSIIKYARMDELSTLNIKVVSGKFQGIMETYVNGNSLTLTTGDLEWAAKGIEYFITFLSALAHEFIHGLQNLKLHIPTHEEKEMMAFLFQLFPDDYIDWLKDKYPNSIPRDWKYNFPTTSTDLDRKHKLEKFLEYWAKTPIAVRAKYAAFYRLILGLYNLLYPQNKIKVPSKTDTMYQRYKMFIQHN